MDLGKNIRERCHVNTNEDGDSFVGVKADTEDAIIYFPIGYQLPDDDDDLRIDINNLLSVLAAFMKEDRVIEASKFEAPRTVDFPMHSYLKIIRDFLRTGRYYVETDPQYRTDTKGSANWPRTVREQRALIQKNGSLVFTNMTIRSVTPNSNKQITQIHRYCVYEAFDKMGWLYVPFMPDNPGPHPSTKESIYILNKKLAATHNDVEQGLFTAMRDMLVYIDKRSSDKQYFFGTDFFDTVWERMIDKAFGVEDKEQYFPRTRWLLDYGRVHEKRPLQPDTIMVYSDKYYVLDAKLYKYGWSANPEHLPNGSDINKQITYGEYIKRTKELPNERLYNAFIMPYNKANNLFMINGNMGNIGEAVGDWRGNRENYERIQGIVVDTRYLMYNYIGTSEQQKQELAECIEKVNSRDPVPEPVT
ncbi:LlaJI family restriction endonuclease [Ethanoligenens harbinense]|nr:LlaJI family restriction endonuclease [Ethanoligenens harbinense YUAN-3]AYF38559.1 LlaJI family restriction endonuclease [Ethanoligenens harbinense]AYF42877.1 LlaJI family restriction endonuclease [Ethanoligenens harbinense]QCN92137.1 LlaJI family restriction endonuclease [Ethanoligenens harbinense]